MGKKLLAEFIGTYFLVFAKTAAVVVNATTHQLTRVGIAWVAGGIVMVMIYAFGHISGAYLNPAVTLSFLLQKEISGKRAFLYILVQFAAGILASLTILSVLGSAASLGTTLPNGSWQQSFVLEMILTFLLMIVILCASVHGKAVKPLAGVAVGATIGLEVMFAGPISGASMNPARSLGPALISGNLHDVWIYLIAPVVGALLATWIYQHLHEKGELEGER